MSTRGLLLAMTVVAVPRLAAAQVGHEGVYALLTIDTMHVPAFRHTFIPGEGTSIDAMTVELERHGDLRGSVVVTQADSGSVTDTIAAIGSWSIRADSLVLDYTWSSRRFGTGGEVHDAGQILSDEIRLNQFAGFGPRFFWPGVVLHFRRG